MPRPNKSFGGWSTSNAVFAGPDHPETLKSLGNLALSIEGARPLRGSRAVVSRSFGRRSSVCLGPNIQTPSSRCPIWRNFFIYRGPTADAEKLGREALAIQLRILGPENPDTP